MEREGPRPSQRPCQVTQRRRYAVGPKKDAEVAQLRPTSASHSSRASGSTTNVRRFKGDSSTICRPADRTPYPGWPTTPRSSAGIIRRHCYSHRYLSVSSNLSASRNQTPVWLTQPTTTYRHL